MFGDIGGGDWQLCCGKQATVMFVAEAFFVGLGDRAGWGAFGWLSLFNLENKKEKLAVSREILLFIFRKQ